MKNQLRQPNNKQIILDAVPLGYLLIDNYSEIGDERIEQFCGFEISKEKSMRLMATLKENEWWTTTHVLTEASNHIEKETSEVSQLQEFFELNEKFINTEFSEYHVSKKKFLDTGFDKGLGIADCSIYELCEDKSNPVVILKDKKLKGQLRGRGIEVIPLSSVINISL